MKVTSGGFWLNDPVLWTTPSSALSGPRSIPSLVASPKSMPNCLPATNYSFENTCADRLQEPTRTVEPREQSALRNDWDRSNRRGHRPSGWGAYAGDQRPMGLDAQIHEPRVNRSHRSAFFPVLHHVRPPAPAKCSRWSIWKVFSPPAALQPWKKRDSSGFEYRSFAQIRVCTPFRHNTE